MTALDLGNFGVNRSNITDYRYVFVNTGKSGTLKNVTVANEDVKGWLNGISTTYVPTYFKNVIQVKS